MASHTDYHNEVRLPVQPNGWQLCFQNCTFHYDEAPDEGGFRFIWRRPDGSLLARGQSRIPDAAALRELLRLATEAGWF